MTYKQGKFKIILHASTISWSYVSTPYISKRCGGEAS